MAKPLIAIVGRPNVGKSTLFNKIIGTRISIVEDTPGVTRDRIYAEGEWLDKKFTLVDTGGIEPKDNNTILRHIKDQAQIAIDTADVILFVTDIRSGVTANDYDVATMLLKSGKPTVLVVNKCDTIGRVSDDIYDFYTGFNMTTYYTRENGTDKNGNSYWERDVYVAKSKADFKPMLENFKYNIQY